MPPDVVHRMIGTILSHYRILEKLGEGGMGVVYKAEDVPLRRAVALKILPTEHSADQEALARFHKEARAASTTNHPHICTIYEVGESDGIHFIAMEFVDGHSLRQEIGPGGIELRRLLQLAAQVAEGLGKAHELGIIHRDVKPENILVSRDGYAKIADFGVAKLRPTVTDSLATSSQIATRAGMVVGSARYMSPEQSLGRPVDSRSDIFSLGLVLYEMATGQAAFERATGIDTLHAIVHDTVPQARLVGTGRPDLNVIIEKATAKDPEDRYQSIRDLALDLRRILRDIETGQRAAVVAPRASSLRWPVFFGALAVALLAVFLMRWGGLAEHLRLGSEAPVAPAAAGDPAAGKTRLVVLPFENLTRQPADDWISAALSDSITFGLENVSSLILVNREGISEVYRQESVQAAAPLDRQVVRKLTSLLAVGYYVHGGYQKIGEDIRVLARLVDARAGEIKAQERVTDRFDYILKLEDELARRLATKLEGGASATTSTRDHTSSLEAYQVVTEARGAYAVSNYPEAIQQLERTVALDPQYADAWALLAKSYARVTSAASFASGSISELTAKAIGAARRAVQLSPASYDAHLALALAHRSAEQAQPWRDEARKALELNPRIAEGYGLLADAYSMNPNWGCVRDRDATVAQEYYRKALQIDPRSSAAYNNLAAHLSWTGSAEEALDVADEGLQVQPKSPVLHRARLRALVALRRVAEDDRSVDVLRKRQTLSALERITLGAVDLQLGRSEVARHAFEQAINQAPLSVNELLVAVYYLESGLPDQAARHLQRTFEREPGCAVFVTNSRVFAPFLKSPAVHAVLGRYGS
jgi:TolB-like protein